MNSREFKMIIIIISLLVTFGTLGSGCLRRQTSNQSDFNPSFVWVTQNADAGTSSGSTIQVVKSLSNMRDQKVEILILDIAILRSASREDLQALQKILSSGAAVVAIGDDVHPNELVERMGIPIKQAYSVFPPNRVVADGLVPQANGQYRQIHVATPDIFPPTQELFKTIQFTIKQAN